MNKYRPLSPHFTIYKIENSSLYSIWHRVTGISNFMCLFIVLCVFKVFTWGIIIQIIDFPPYINYILLSLLYYHILNGYRYFIWDTNNFLNNSFIKQSTYLITIVILLTLIINQIQIS